MTSSSPSEFLTFYRRFSTSSTLRRTSIRRTPIATRPFVSTSYMRYAESPNVVSDAGTQHDTGAGNKVGASREHALDKGDKNDPNIQSYESSHGRSSRSQDTGGSATRQKDERDSTAKAKKEHPEAPDTVIGMQDERGGKGA